MIPLGDDTPTLRTPVVTIGLLLALLAVWVLVQGAGFDALVMARSVCDLGLVPGELSGRAAIGAAVPIGEGLACVVDRDRVNALTPLTSMFLHGSWGHLVGNALFLWVFGANVEDSMGRWRFLAFYLVCGAAAAAAQVAVNPGAAVPMVGASGAISGVLGAYLVLYPKVRVNVLLFFFIFIRIISVPAYLLLLWWVGWQVLTALPQLNPMREISSGVAVFAHIGGFAAGLVLVKLFENRRRVEERIWVRHRLRPEHP